MDHLKPEIPETGCSKKQLSSKKGFVPSYQQMVENSPNMVAYLDRAMTYRLVNKAYANWNDLEPEQLIGKTVFGVHGNLLGEGFAKDMVMQLNQALKGEPVSHEIRARHHSGEIRWVYVSYLPDINHEGEIHGVYAYVSDISDRKEEGETRTFLQLALDQGIDGFSLHDKVGKYTYVNASKADMYGYTREELLGQHWSIIYPPDQEQYIRSTVFPLLQQNGHWRGELVGKRKNGSLLDVEVSLTLLIDKLDHPVGLVCNFQNITEKKKTELALRQAAAVFESAAEGVVITDNQFQIIATNPVYTLLSGYQEEDVVGLKAEALYCLDQSEVTVLAIQETLEKTGKWQGEIYHQKQSGATFPTWQTIAPVKDKNGHVINYVLVLDDISQLKRSQEKLYQLAHYDHLTGLPNRMLLNERLDQALKKADKSGYQVAVLFLDLDNFKHINDTQGHAFGDKLLCAVANRIVSVCRDDDVIARVSGDEFVIVVEHLKHSSMAARLAEKLLDNFNSSPLSLEGRDYYQNVSIGISVYPKDGPTVDDLMKHADTAMYQSKKDGRQTFHFYDGSMSQLALEHINLDRQLRLALEHSQFELHYQPIVEIRSLKVVGMEALIRWNHPECGLTFPDRFIPHAEGSKLILGIGDWVLRESCRQAKEWLDNGIVFDHMAVNVSGNQLRADFVETVKQTLKDTGLPPQKLELEVTETYLMTDLTQPIDVLTGLSEMGVSISIDDFGVGYSSLSRLKQLPIQRLKVDRSFIRDIAVDANDWSIVKAIIAMSESLGLSITAEGVETKEHRDLLAPYENVQAQGYYFAKPAPAGKIPEIISSIES